MKEKDILRNHMRKILVNTVIQKSMLSYVDSRDYGWRIGQKTSDICT